MESSMPAGTAWLYRRLADDVAALGSPASPPAPAADLAALPDAAVRYLNFMGVPGRLRTPRSWRMSPGGSGCGPAQPA